VFDPFKDIEEQSINFVAVGWDKRIRIWKDLKNDNSEDA
jgi:hypothetical protein